MTKETFLSYSWSLSIFGVGEGKIGVSYKNKFELPSPPSIQNYSLTGQTHMVYSYLSMDLTYHGSRT